jgi:alpha-L-arabinofuranosidase
MAFVCFAFVDQFEKPYMLTKRMFSGLVAGILMTLTLQAQSPWTRLRNRPSTLGLEKGYLSVSTNEFRLTLVRASQTVASLRPIVDPDVDFTPGDSLQVRSGNGLYQLGDLNLRLRVEGDTAWTMYATAADRHPVRALNPGASPDSAGGALLAAADLAPTFPAGIPLHVERRWEEKDGHLILAFVLTNKGDRPVEVGALGIPLIFDNILDGESLEQAHARNVFYDPYIGRDAGYLQVTRLNGEGPGLLVTPSGHTPFEAYNPLLDDPTPRSAAFEGFYEWMVYSKAYAGKEWKNAEPWNEPTSVVLAPGQVCRVALSFALCPSVRAIDSTLIAGGRPVALGVPGYVLPQDVQGRLFLHYTSPVRSMSVSPAEALTVHAPDTLPGGWASYAIQGHTWGRARLTVTYTDGTEQTIHYKVIQPEDSVVRHYGHFLMTRQWYDVAGDTFHRNPSVISYDRTLGQQVTQDNRAWIAGLSDEAGAGSWLGALMKQAVIPDKTEVRQLQRFVDSTLWGRIQYANGPERYGVRKSLFYYEPDSMPAGTYRTDIRYKTWSAWPLKEAASVGRSYNYPHVAAAYWVMYRLARFHKDLLPADKWTWYLSQAYETSMAMLRLAPYYAQFGQMEGTVFYLILRDLQAEGMIEQARALETAMKGRALHWRSLPYPFGSEMPWDSTGQEEVYVWSHYFGFPDKADVTLKAILAYMPTIPHWAYNGNARRYWDFLYAGKTQRIERMIHHYGSALNALPVLEAYREHPDDFYLLRVGYGGRMGALSNITEDGFAPCAFHAWPSTLANDGYTGDYGSGFFGYAVNAGTYVAHHPVLGWLAYGGNLSTAGTLVRVQPTTAARSAVFIAPARLWVRLNAGKIHVVTYDTVTREVRLSLDSADAFTSTGSMIIDGAYTAAYPQERGAYRVPLGEDVILKPVGSAVVTIDTTHPGARIPSTLHGIFFEEISHAGDGGLYAELIQNRGFEESTIPQGTRLDSGFLVPWPERPHFMLEPEKTDWKMEWPYVNDPWPGWSAHGGVTLSLVTDNPLNTATPHSLGVQVMGRGEVINSGYWGISVVQGDSYRLSFYSRGGSYTAPVTASLQSADGTVLATHTFAPGGPGWHRFACVLKATRTDSAAKFVLSFDGKGKLWLDFVSLFPAKTFKGRPNGLRDDLGRLIAGLKPAFVRWPGGCYAEGITIASAADWKKTIGPIEKRPETFSPWGYWSTNGFGYDEYLRFCEDIGASALFVCNVGVSCEYRSGIYVPEDSLQPYIQDALDAIEYAIGPVTSPWGKRRAQAGHPAPYPLRYVEIGNEQHGPKYASRYNLFYDAIHRRYPKLTLIASMGIGDVNRNTLQDMKTTDMVDEHAYKDAFWSLRNTDHFDRYKRGQWDMYVGEFATNAGVGHGNMRAALSDAVYMMGMERNADLVRMSSYAPLLANVHDVDWPVNLINFDAARSYGRISYYAIKMFTDNRPDVNLPTRVTVAPVTGGAPAFSGGIGLATWDTQTEYKDVDVSVNGRSVYHSNAAGFDTGWAKLRGTWVATDGGGLAQTAEGAQRVALLKNRSFDTYSLTLKARKLGGYNAFIIPFAVRDSNTFLRAHIGSYVNANCVFESVTDGYEVADITNQKRLPHAIETGRWYTIRLDVGQDKVDCYLDGELLMTYKGLPALFALSGKEEKTGDVLVKVVNAGAGACAAHVALTGYRLSHWSLLTAPGPDAENSLGQPAAYVPREIEKAGDGTDAVLPAYSISVLRFKAASSGE